MSFIGTLRKFLGLGSQSRAAPAAAAPQPVVVAAAPQPVVVAAAPTPQPKGKRRRSSSGQKKERRNSIVLASAEEEEEEEVEQRTTRHLDLDASSDEGCIRIIKSLNNLINCFDPAKDAMASFYLDPAREPGHPYRVERKRGVEYLVDPEGRYIMGRLGVRERPLLEELYRYLYHVDRIPPNLNGVSLRSSFTGVGNNKELLRHAVESVFHHPRITQHEYQSFPKLRSLVLGLASWRVSNMFIAFDTPKAFSDIGDESCKRLIGPFSLLDGAPRDTDDPNQVDLLEYNSRYRDEEDIFQMNKYLDRIEYTKAGGADPYRFTFARTHAGNKDFTFNAAGNSTDTDVNLSTNAYRNREIYYQMRDAGAAGAAGVSPQDKVNDAFRIFYKEGGDTFIIAWLKQYMGQYNLVPENTAVYTLDLTLLLRAIINGVQCIYYSPGGQDITLFPILTRSGAGVDPAVAAAAAARQRMVPLRDMLFTHNMRILNLIAECGRRASQADFSINEYSNMLEPQHVERQRIFRENMRDMQQAIHGVCQEMYRYVRDIIIAVEREVGAVDLDTIDEEDFRQNYIINYKLACPFFPGQGNSFTWNKVFTSFLKEDTEEEYASHQFDLSKISLLYTNVYSPPHHTVEQLRDIILNRLVAQDEGQGGGGKPKNFTLKPIADVKFSKQEQKHLEEILEMNSHLPNFILYSITTYAPELFYIAYAYAFAMNKAAKEYESLFDHAFTTKLCEPFGRIGNDGIVEYTAPEKAPADTNDFCVTVCAFLASIESLDSQTSELTLFQACAKRAPQVLWFIKTLGKEPMELSLKDTNIHSEAYQYYQDLYTKNLDLCVINQRQTKSPLVGLKRISIKESIGKKSLGTTGLSSVQRLSGNKAVAVAGGGRRRTHKKLRGKRRTQRR